MHDEHSHDELFCFATIDLNTSSDATGAGGLGVVSILLVEVKAVVFPKENAAETAGVCCTDSLALLSSVLPIFELVEVVSDLFKFPNENEADEVDFMAPLPNENVGAALTVVETLAVVLDIESNIKPAFASDDDDDDAPRLPKEIADFAGTAPLDVAPFVTSLD